MNGDHSFFARQLRQIAASGADGQAQVERIRELLELQRQAHAQSEQENLHPIHSRRPLLALE